MKMIIENTYQMILLAGIIFFILGFITQKFPPKKINTFYGYRTNASMKNQKQWDFAQQYASTKMMQLAIAMMLCSFFKIILKEQNEKLISLIVLLSGVFYLLFTTEKAIRNKFPSDVD